MRRRRDGDPACGARALLLGALLAAGCGSSGHTPSASTSTTSTTVAGLYGVVTAGPTCPVERADQPCPPRPVAGARIDALDRSGRSIVHANSDTNGNFSLALAPGTYTLSASTGSAFPRCSPMMATVIAGGRTRADISCDTGIR